MSTSALQTIALFHRLLHPHFRRHIHLRSLDLTVGTWQLVLWLAVIPAAWALYRFVYHRRPAHRTLAYAAFVAVGLFQASAYLSFALSRNADVLFVLLWCSLLALLTGGALLPSLRFGGPRGTAAGGEAPG